MNLADKISEAFSKKGIPNVAKLGWDTLEFYDKHGEEIFTCTVTTDFPTSDIMRFTVKRNGQGLAKAALQSIAKHFTDAGVSYIGLHMVRDSGLSFWPRFGAVPSDGALSQRCYAKPLIEDYFIHKYGEYLMDAYNIAEQDPIEAWYYLTDPKTKTPRELIERLNMSSHNSSMYIDLSHALVRERLGLD